MGAPFCRSTPLVGWRLHLRQGVLRTLGPQGPFSWLVKWWRHIRRGKPSGQTPGYSLLFPYTECSPPRARRYSEKRLSLSHPHLQSPRLRASAWREKQATAQEASNLFPKEAAPFSTECASSNAPKSSGECSEGEWEETCRPSERRSLDCGLTSFQERTKSKTAGRSSPGGSTNTKH